MAAKKYYCVKRGKITGVFDSWEGCKASVEGYPKAEYKGFSTLEEARAYLGDLYCLRFEADEDAALSGGQDLSAAYRGAVAQKTGSAAADRGAVVQKDGSAADRGAVVQKDGLAADRGAVVQKDGSAASRRAAVPKNGVGTAASAAVELPAPGQLLAYVDGSYDDARKKYAFGCVFLLPDGRIFTEYGNGDNEASLRHRNVTGEMLGAMFAVKFALLNGFSGLEIRYDYAGIEKWVTGEWRAKTERTAEYAAAMRQWSGNISLRFTKVAAHTNVYYNDLADKMAKTGLKMGQGVPKVRRIEDMEEYHGTDAAE